MRPIPGIRAPALLAALFLALPPVVHAGGAHVRITAPAPGAMLDRTDPVTLAYEAAPGPKGDHVHVYVDGRETAMLRPLEGSHTVGLLAPGKRMLCVKLVNRTHTPVGVEQCVGVQVK